MKRLLFSPKLAWEGIRKNRRLYIPYLLSCIGMIMMSYIMEALSVSPVTAQIKGGSNVIIFLSIGKMVIAFFAVLFLFYTNSFLTRRRYHELGLYSVLGMDRRSINRIVLCESLIVAFISMTAGLGLGILFSKLAELGLLNAVRGEINYHIYVSPRAVAFTLIIFSMIFTLLLLRSILQVRKSRPLELMRSESTGEKAPKANWFLAVIGLSLLILAYWISATIKTPLSALILFFAAVIMVIIATYLLFVSGSVVLCKGLQKSKRYYYRKDHFVSVSTMAYRMKRNGAGLASICILATMVLVMVASSSSLYFGADDAIETAYPVDTQLVVECSCFDDVADDKIDELRIMYEQTFSEHCYAPDELHDYRYAVITGMQTGDHVNLDSRSIDASLLSYDDMRMLYFVSVADYNRAMGTSYSLSTGEAMVSAIRCDFDRTEFTMGGVSLRVVGAPEKTISISEAYTMVIPSLIMIIPDYETIRPLESLVDYNGDPMLSCRWYFGYNWMEKIDTASGIDMFTAQKDAAKSYYAGTTMSLSAGCIALEKQDFYTTFGGLFFLGVILSVVFIFATVVIIYYKQVSEGYEDQKRFEIMRKVGMTDNDIRKSINAQVLTVFFAPLFVAGLHLAFAFPFVWKLLQLFNLRNLTLVTLITIGAYLAFGVIYACIYKLTAGAYYRIVSTVDR